jgi:dipeptidyl aminopeptidase/acylaminoacyl peptidase
MAYDFARYLNIRSAIMPAMAPDGRRIAFLTDITGVYQLWSVAAPAADPTDPAARWPVQLTFFADKVWEFHAAPAAGRLIAVSDADGNERQQFYLVTGYGDGAHDVRRLTNDDRAIHRFGVFSSDGDQIVYTSNARNHVDFDPYWMDLTTGESRRIASAAGNCTIVAWSPDGGTLLMVDAQAAEQHELYLVDLASGAERHLTAARAPARYLALTWTTGGLFTLSDRERDRFALCRLDPETAALEEILAADALLDQSRGEKGELELLAVSKDGRRAALTLNVEGYSRLYQVNLEDGSWSLIAPPSLPEGVIGSLAFAGNGDQLLFDLQNPTRNPDVWLCDLASGGCQPVTFSNRAGIPRARFVEPELIRFPTFDGLDVPAFYYRPSQDPPPGGYPCILYVHGGPASQQRPDFDVRFQYFLQRGYAILAPNVRGSTGYGRAYVMSDDVELRMDSVADLKHAVLWLQARPEIAADRIAIYGRSYGGFMVLAALTEYPDLFAAGIDVVGIANWVTFLERTSAWRRAHRSREYGALDEHRDLLVRMSPIHKAERITMPLLVLAGDNDPRVPLYESEQVAERVRATGGVVEFIHYADEGHKFSKLANRIDSFTRMAEFLDRYV